VIIDLRVLKIDFSRLEELYPMSAESRVLYFSSTIGRVPRQMKIVRKEINQTIANSSKKIFHLNNPNGIFLSFTRA
jgi:hypothetical protein